MTLRRGWQTKEQEDASTGSPPKAGELRKVRTFEGDDGENPGLYLVLRPTGETFDKEARRAGAVEPPLWLVLVLQADPDVHDERDGGLAEHDEKWLADWSEPWEP